MELQIAKNNIRNLREVNNMSVVELANMLGITRQNLYKIEKGERSISLTLQEKLCNVFNCNISDLYNDSEIKVELVKELSLNIKFYPNLLQDGCDMNIYETITIPEKLIKILEIKKNNLIATKIYEKNMEPVISKNDFMIIDLDKKDILNNKIYLIKENNKLKIKRIRQSSPFDTTITILSENQIDGEYPPYEIDINIAKNNILGQVVFYGRSIL